MIPVIARLTPFRGAFLWGKIAYSSRRQDTLERERKLFEQNIGWMLEDYFEDLPSRKRGAYAEAFAAYRRDVSSAIQDCEEYGDEPLMV